MMSKYSAQRFQMIKQAIGQQFAKELARKVMRGSTDSAITRMVQRLYQRAKAQMTSRPELNITPFLERVYPSLKDVLAKFSSHQLQMVKKALEQYDPTPFSGLTALSDFVANRKHAPKPPKKMTSDGQAAMEAAKEGLPPHAERTVNKVKAKRQTALI